MPGYKGVGGRKYVGKIKVSSPNMYGIGNREKTMRSKQEKGLEVSAKKRQSKYKAASKIAFQSGATAYGYKMSAKAQAQGKKAVQHGYRKSKYAGDI
jgi:uncharacterized protein (DUF169 family)